MGMPKAATFELYCGVLAVVLSVFLSWVLFNVYQSASTVLESNASRNLMEEVLCPWIFGRYSALQVTMACTMASVAFFLLSAVFCALFFLGYFAVCHSCAIRRALSSLAMLCLVLGYAFLLVTHFERLRLTFSGTTMQLPNWAPRVLYIVALTFALLCICAAVFVYISVAVTVLCIVLLVLLYFVSVSVMMRKFYTKAIGIAAGDESMDIIDTVLRISVVVIVSLLSTCIVFIHNAVSEMICINCLRWQLVGWTLIELDIALNAFCLMCTFSAAKGYYKRVFGPIHGVFLARVVSSRLPPVAVQIGIERIGSGTDIE